jgi:2'-5' RNA ligase
MAYRLFVAIELPEAVKDQLVKLRADIPGASWVKPNGYHLTLRFLGDGIEAERLNSIRELLQDVQSPPFSMRLRGVGRFPPNARRAARVLWVGVTAPPPLKALYQQVEGAVVSAGFPPEERDFHPHITLARLKSFKPEQKVDRFLEQHQTFSTAEIAVTEFFLFSSVLTPQGSIYEKQGAYRLRSS